MTFVELQGKWSQVRAEVELEKVYALISSSDESQVRSSFSLLLSLDDCGLCEVLHEVVGQLRIREDVVVYHRLLWERCILDEVIQEGSIWHDLYVGDCFRSLELRVLGNTSWDELSEPQQKKVVLESLQSVEVPAGTFMMGALVDDEEAIDYERPRHEVILTKSMMVCMYACTQGLYASVMGHNPSDFVGSMRPVEQVSWCDAVLFCNKLSEREGLEPCYVLPKPFKNDKDWSKNVKWDREANGYRLLTEAEWEYCGQGGEDYLYAGSDNIDEVAWYSGNSRSKTQPVGEKTANEFGLYGMSGNVLEWCWDTAILDDEYNFTGASLYTLEAQTDPIVESSSPNRISRGGSWYFDAWYTRVTDRDGRIASFRGGYLGFRFVRTVS